MGYYGWKLLLVLLFNKVYSKFNRNHKKNHLIVKKMLNEFCASKY